MVEYFVLRAGAGLLLDAARADRHVLKVGKHPAARQFSVDRLHHVSVHGHYLAFEGAEKQQSRLHIEFEPFGHASQRPAKGLRTHGQHFHVECRSPGQHAEALAQQEQLQAVLELRARGCVGQHTGLLDFQVVDQGELITAPMPRLQLAAHDLGVLQVGDLGFERVHEVEHDVGAGVSHLVLGELPLRTQRLVHAALDLPIQQLLEFPNGAVDAVLEIGGHDLEDRLQQLAHAARQGLRGQSWKCG